MAKTKQKRTKIQKLNEISIAKIYQRIPLRNSQKHN